MPYDLKTSGAAVATISVTTTEDSATLVKSNVYELRNVGAGDIRFTTDGSAVDAGDDRIGLGLLQDVSLVFGVGHTITGVETLKFLGAAASILVITRSGRR